MSRSLFSEATYNGIGFGLGFAVTMNPAQTLIPGSPGEYNWGGAATTSFWIDPAEELITIFMTQVLPSSAYPLRRELRTHGLFGDHREQSLKHAPIPRHQRRGIEVPLISASPARSGAAGTAIRWAR